LVEAAGRGLWLPPARVKGDRCPVNHSPDTGSRPVPVTGPRLSRRRCKSGHDVPGYPLLNRVAAGPPGGVFTSRPGVARAPIRLQGVVGAIAESPRYEPCHLAKHIGAGHPGVRCLPGPPVRSSRSLLLHACPRLRVGRRPHRAVTKRDKTTVGSGWIACTCAAPGGLPAMLDPPGWTVTLIGHRMLR
jgi:hypothetical protein